MFTTVRSRSIVGLVAVLTLLAAAAIGAATGLVVDLHNSTRPAVIAPVTPSAPTAQVGQATSINFGTNHPHRFQVSRYLSLAFDTTAATRCIQQGVSCRPAYVQRINAARAEVGSAPLHLNLTMSRGLATGCPGSAGHSRAMADTGQIWHIAPDAGHDYASFNKDVCITGAVQTEGENVGEAPGYNKWDGIVTLDDLFTSEPWTPGCQGNHHCNLLFPGYTDIGVGIVQKSNVIWLTLDFAG